MALEKELLKSSIENGFSAIFRRQSAKATTEGAEGENPNDVIANICKEMADVVANAVESYVKGGDIYVGEQNISVESSDGPCLVTPVSPAKIV